MAEQLGRPDSAIGAFRAAQGITGTRPALPFCATPDRLKKGGLGCLSVLARLQVDGAKAFVDSWQDLLGAIDKKASQLG